MAGGVRVAGVLVLAAMGAARGAPCGGQLLHLRLRSSALGARHLGTLTDGSELASGVRTLRLLRGGGNGEEAEDNTVGVPRQLHTLVVSVIAGLSVLIALGVVQAAQLLSMAINAALASLSGTTRFSVSQQQVLASLLATYVLAGFARRVARAAAVASAVDAAAAGTAGAPAPGPAKAQQGSGGGPPRRSLFPFLDGIQDRLSDIDLDRPMRERLRAQIRWYEPNATRVTFADVAGCDEAVAEVRGVVDFLKDPQRYARLGARMPRGVLLEGPPGTGKTLLAKALASEAGVAFASVPGPTIGAQRFAGVSSAFVAELFANATSRAPCVIYIDEVDSLGAARSAGAGDVSRDKADALNSLLTAMDGFDTPPNLAPSVPGERGAAAIPPAVVVLASTNRADILDPALLRPGRFDRRVTLRLPGGKARAQILAVCARTRRLDARARASLGEIAARTGGLSGAQLEAVINEGAIGAAARDADAVTTSDLLAALDKVTIGLKLGRALSPGARELAAVHEAGHALVAIAAERWLQSGGRALDAPSTRVSEVTIASRAGMGGVSGGHTAFRADDSKLEAGVRTARDLLAEMCVAMGGRMAEELEAGRAGVSSGAEADLEGAWRLAAAFVGRLGMSALGPIHVQGNGGYGAGSGGPASTRISEEEHRLMRCAADAAGAVLRANRGLHSAIVSGLLANETLDRSDLDRIVGLAPERLLPGSAAAFGELSRRCVGSDRHSHARRGGGGM